MDNEIISNIKSLALDMIATAESGHPGIVLSSAPILYTLFSKHFNISLNDSQWINRDRLVLSAGHGSALLYSCLHMAGFDITIEDLKNFRRLNSKTPGHPEYGIVPGVEITTGPLGQGFGTAVGMALGEKILSSKYVIPKKNAISLDNHLIDYKVYVLCSDGDLMEGISSEAASLAGTLKLNNLIVLYDSNNISLDGNTSYSFRENVLSKFKACGWNTILVQKGRSIDKISKAIAKAKNSSKPTIIEIKTILGDGLMSAGTNQAHSQIIKKNELEAIKQSLGIPNESFYVSSSAKQKFMEMISSHSSVKYREWATNYKEYVSKFLSGDFSKLNYLFDRNEKINLLNYHWNFEKDLKEPMRNINQNIMLEIAKMVPNFIGGSADLSSSTKTYLEGYANITSANYNGRNIWFGVREHLMGAMINGLALSKFKPFGSTFLSFSDYLKPAIRLAAISKIPSIYIFTHDSVSIGSDGPTHQPIEQLSSLRSIPNLNVYRPADVNEIIGCWNTIINSESTPSALVISKSEVEILPTTNAEFAMRGAYIVFQPDKIYSAIIIATGTEVHTAFHVANDLWRENGISVRVVSMPCMELYNKQIDEYKNQLLPKNIKTFVIEAGCKFGWEGFVQNDSYLITIDKFGASGTSSEVLKYCNFDYETIKNRIISLL